MEVRPGEAVVLPLLPQLHVLDVGEARGPYGSPGGTKPTSAHTSWPVIPPVGLMTLTGQQRPEEPTGETRAASRSNFQGSGLCSGGEMQTNETILITHNKKYVPSGRKESLKVVLPLKADCSCSVSFFLDGSHLSPGNALRIGCD